MRASILVPTRHSTPALTSKYAPNTTNTNATKYFPYFSVTALTGFRISWEREGKRMLTANGTSPGERKKKPATRY